MKTSAAILARIEKWKSVGASARRAHALMMIATRNGRRAQANYRKRGINPTAIARAVQAKMRAEKKQREFERKMLGLE